MRKIRKRIIKLLLWSQKHTKADMLYIVKGGSWVAFGQTFNSIFSLVLIIAFANLLPKETYGTYRYILSIAGILNIFTLTGMNEAVARTVAKGGDGVLRPAVSYQLKWNLLMFLASSILGGYYLINGDSMFGLSIIILGIFTPLTLAFNTYGSYLEGKKKFGIANIFSIISTFIYSAGTLIILLFTDSIEWLIFIYALATFIPSCLFYMFVVRKFNLSSSTDISNTLKYGRSLTYLRLIDPIVSQIDKIILAHFWGPAQLATYSLASAIPARATLFIKGWVAVGFPKFSEKNIQEINTVFYKRMFQGMSIGFIMMLLYVFISPYLFIYLLPQYTEGIFYSQLLAISFIFALPNRYISLIISSQGLTQILFKRSFLISMINLLLYITCGIWGGLLGLIIANILSTLISLILNIVMWQTAFKSKNPSY